MSGFGYGGVVGELLDALPTDSTFHITDCGYDDNDERCGCYDLPSKLRQIVARHVAAALEQAADSIEAIDPVEWALAGQSAGAQAAAIVRAQIHN